MKRFFVVVFLLVGICGCGNKQEVQAASIESYWAKSYIVMEQSSHKVIASKSPNYVQSVASISKIMTAIIAIESGKLADRVTIGNEISKIYGSQVYLKVDDVVTLEELVYGLLLRSGNDCAVVIATYLSSKVEDFVQLMNDKAASLGMKLSHFSNPHGLDEEDDGNQSCALDMALLLSYALNSNTFCTISQTKDYSSSKYGKWHNKNRLLNEYKYITSGKTGYTVKAKRTLATSAKKDNTELVIITINCGDDFHFHKYLYEKYFPLYQTRIVITQGLHNVENYNFICEKDYLFFQKKEDWNNSKLLYEHVESTNTIGLYLLNGNQKYFIASFIIDEEEEEQTFKERLSNFFRRIFNE